MSTTKININQLPEADEVKPGDFFVIDDEVITKRINFTNVIFGLDNVTFASTISAHTTEIADLSSNLDSLSGQLYGEVDVVNTNIGVAMAQLSAGMINILYPVNSVKYTTDNKNPGSYLIGTVWTQIAQGRFIAGVGPYTDPNNNNFIVREADDPDNIALGEVKHTITVAEMPSHAHSFQPLYNGKADGNSSDKNEGTIRTVGGVVGTYSSGTDSVGGSNSHNNIPPFWGLYVWKRVA